MPLSKLYHQEGMRGKCYGVAMKEEDMIVTCPWAFVWPLRALAHRANLLEIHLLKQ